MDALLSCKVHKNNSSSVSLNARHYKRKLGNKSHLFDLVFPVTCKSMCFGWKNNWTQERTVDSVLKEEINNLFNQLPIDTKVTRRSLNKKGVITKAIYVPRKNIKLAIKRATAGGKKEEQHLHRLKLINFYSVKGVFTSEYRLDGCRLFEVTQGLQGLKKEYRRILLSGTGYADLDAQNSLPNDLLRFIQDLELTPVYKAMYNRIKYYVNNKDAVMKEYGINKAQYLALILGQKQTHPELKNIQSLIKFFTLKHISTSPTPIDTKIEWNKYLAHELFKLEKEKIFIISQVYAYLGYKTLVYCFDGLILDSEPDINTINLANEMYNHLTGSSIKMVLKETF